MKRIFVVLGLLCAFGLATPAIGQDKAATPPAAEAKAPDAKAEVAPAAAAAAPAPATAVMVSQGCDVVAPTFNREQHFCRQRDMENKP